MFKFKSEKENSIFASFTTIKDFEYFKGIHSIKITLEDEKGGKNEY